MLFKVITLRRRMDRRDFFLLVLAVLLAGSDAMSKQQLKNTGKMLKKQCIAKIGVMEDKVKDIDKGKFIEEKEVMCYIACIFQMSQIIINIANKKAKHCETAIVFSFTDAVRSYNRNLLKIKNNKLNYEASIKQVDMMYPPEIKESAKASIEKCKDVHKKYKDLCEASYWTAKCIHDDNPKDFIFA